MVFVDSLVLTINITYYNILYTAGHLPDDAAWTFCLRSLPLCHLPKWGRFGLLLRYILPAFSRFLCAFYRSRAGLGFCFGISCLLSAASTAPFTEVEQVWASASV